MFHLAYPRGQRPAFADLPPTLQPCAIAASAPPSDHLRTAAFSGLIYLLLGGTVMAFVSLAPPVVVVTRPPTQPERIIEFGGPALPRVIERVLRPAGGAGGGSDSTPLVNAGALPHLDPDEATEGLPTKDRSGDQVAAPSPNSNPLQPPGITKIGTGSGSIIHDYTTMGLTVLHQVNPVYPEFARHAHIQGAVVLKMIVDERGQPVQVLVLEGHPAFHEAAMQAARQWRFEPARVDGQPVMASFQLTLKFSLR